MAKIEFSKNDLTSYDVRVLKDSAGHDWDELGTLELDSESGLWVLWTGVSYTDPAAMEKSGALWSDDGTSYFESLKETETAIKADYAEN